VILNTLNPKLLTSGLDLATVEIQESEATDPPAPAAGGPVDKGTTGPTGEKGTCAGIATSGGAKNQCGLVSNSLSGMLGCMEGKGTDSLGSVYSISASNVGDNLAKAQACCGDPSCNHATYTCHYGCRMSDQGYSHAVDFSWKSSDDTSLCKIADAARSCGAGSNIWGPKTLNCPGGARITKYEGHDDHLHIPTADCNH